MDMKTKINQACSTAEEFTKLYYESVDKKRHQVSKLFLDSGTLVWNGNAVCGKDQIQKFFEELPATQHIVISLDAQPVFEEAVAKQPTVLVQVAGNVRLQDKSQQAFQQNFMLTAQGDKWKIVTDCFRFQQPLNS